ncbi:amidohydrolase [Streptacidiphilus sp. 4-A2]|nr:amidohydrolase [Streptacidiphilus sp. 4-A2]
MRKWLATSVAKALPRALEVYLNVHRHPELSDVEQETAALFGAVLEDLDCQVTYGVGGHGVVATLTNGPGRRIMLRAELDALPIEEKTGLPYASTATGYRDGLTVPVMHACGHDAHLAAVLGAVEVLAGARNRWRGTVMVVAQPAEETLSGAAAMVADGLYERFGRPDVALAQHLAVFPAGRVAHGDVVLAASRSLRIHMQGVGGHAADPTSSVNPIEAAADLVIGLRASLVHRPPVPSARCAPEPPPTWCPRAPCWR